MVESCESCLLVVETDYCHSRQRTDAHRRSYLFETGYLPKDPNSHRVQIVRTEAHFPYSPSGVILSSNNCTAEADRSQPRENSSIARPYILF